MFTTPRLRRWVASLLTVTLVPFTSGCHHEATVSLGAAAPLIGKKVRITVAAGTEARLEATDGTSQLVPDVTVLEGVLLAATTDSVRLGDVMVWRATGSRTPGYRTAAIKLTGDVAATQTKIEPVRTTLAVTGVVLLGMALVGIVVVAAALGGMLSWGLSPAHP